MTSPPKLLRGAYRTFAQNAEQTCSRGGLIPKVKLKEMFNLFTQGRWEDLIIASQQCDADALKVSSRRRTQQGDSVEKRAAEAPKTAAKEALTAKAAKRERRNG